MTTRTIRIEYGKRFDALYVQWRFYEAKIPALFSPELDVTVESGNLDVVLDHTHMEYIYIWHDGQPETTV